MVSIFNKAESLMVLKQKVEELLKDKKSIANGQHSEGEILEIIHELEVNQFEVENHQEKLLRSKVQAEIAVQKYTQLYDFAPVGYFTLTNSGKIIELNLACSQLLGKERSNLVNSRFDFFITNDTKSIFNNFLVNIFNKDVKECCEVKIFLEDGYLMNAYLVGILSKNKDQALITIVDITELKVNELALRNSEERYRDLLENIDVGIILHDKDSNVIFSNPKACKLIGLNKENIIGKQPYNPIWKVISNDYIFLSLEDYPVNKIINRKKGIENFIFGIKKPDATSIKWLLLNGFPILNEEREITEVVISFVEITELKKLEIELTNAKEKAELANKSKSSFLTNMSHEIRTPLNGIVGFTDLLMKTNLDQNQTVYMNMVNESAIILIDIINDILDFSKIESGKLELNIEEVNLLELSQHVIDIFKYQSELNKIDLILNIEDKVPNFVFADSVRLKQILVNLIGNAIKFTKNGFVKLTISRETISEDDNRCHLNFSVKDTGIGIKPKNQEKVFQSFIQEDCTITRKFGGTGLGLAISNQLLGLMNSELKLKSKFGHGSEFYFSIDLEIANHEVISEEEEEKSINYNKTNSSDDFSNKKILVVEDNRINMLLIKTLLKSILPGSIILESSDGIKAIKMYKKEKPDLILMDIQMPIKNGYQTTAEIKNLKRYNKTPIIALTAGTLLGEKEKCLEFGMDDYISKPILKSKLEEVLYKWFKKISQNGNN